MTTSTGNRTHKPSTKKIREHNTRHSCVKLEQTRIFFEARETTNYYNGNFRHIIGKLMTTFFYIILAAAPLATRSIFGGHKNSLKPYRYWIKIK